MGGTMAPVSGSMKWPAWATRVRASGLLLSPLAMGCLRIEPRARPGRFQRLPREEQPLVQPEGAILPELEGQRRNAEARPVGWPRHFAEREAGRVFGNRFLESKAAFERARLLRGPGADAAFARTGGEIFICLGGRHLFDRAAQAHLPAQGFPMEAQGRLGRRGEFLALAALIVRIENEAPLVIILKEHHADIRHP